MISWSTAPTVFDQRRAEDFKRYEDAKAAGPVRREDEPLPLVLRSSLFNYADKIGQYSGKLSDHTNESGMLAKFDRQGVGFEVEGVVFPFYVEQRFYFTMRPLGTERTGPHAVLLRPTEMALDLDKQMAGRWIVLILDVLPLT